MLSEGHRMGGLPKSPYQYMVEEAVFSPQFSPVDRSDALATIGKVLLQGRGYRRKPASGRPAHGTRIRPGHLPVGVAAESGSCRTLVPGKLEAEGCPGSWKLRGGMGRARQRRVLPVHCRRACIMALMRAF